LQELLFEVLKENSLTDESVDGREAVRGLCEVANASS
jgi:hypothetical protein